MTCVRITAAALLSLALAAPAFAQQTTVSRQLEIIYSDLDLATASGAATLLSRLDAAARKTCRALHTGRSTEDVAAFRSCRETALVTAAAAINNATVTALLQDHLHPSKTTELRLMADRG